MGDSSTPAQTAAAGSINRTELLTCHQGDGAGKLIARRPLRAKQLSPLQLCLDHGDLEEVPWLEVGVNCTFMPASIINCC
jgi:hypothetical protein